jgi:hypothetical protein
MLGAVFRHAPGGRAGEKRAGKTCSGLSAVGADKDVYALVLRRGENVQ